MTWQILQADARALPLEDHTVDLIACSPPYWGLRSYRDGGEHYDGQVGSEVTPAQYVDELVGMIDGEWRRVLKPSGSLFLNMGDKYAGDAQQPQGATGQRANRKEAMAKTYRKTDNAGMARTKSLLGLPWRVALALIDRGWILRSEIIWAKPNGLPESVTDRVRRSHEQVFHLVLNPHYFSAVDELRSQGFPPGPVGLGPADPLLPAGVIRCEKCHGSIQAVHLPDKVLAKKGVKNKGARTADLDMTTSQVGSAGVLELIEGNADGRERLPNLGEDGLAAVGDVDSQVRTAATAMSERHAALPVDDPGQPSKVCSCAHPLIIAGGGNRLGRLPGSVWVIPTQPLIIPDTHKAHWNLPDHFAAYPPELVRRIVLGWSPVGGLVCDPMCGTGTTVGVAHKLGRHGIGVDLSEDYCRLARWRIEASGHFDTVDSKTMHDQQGTLL